MPGGLKLGLLGPLEVSDDGRVIALTSARQRAILALLALEAPAVVPVDRIVEEVWGEGQPADPAAALHTQVSRLRAALGPECIATHEAGYRLEVGRDAIDVHRFTALVRQAADDPAQRAEPLLIQALGMWRGPPLADVADAPFVAGARRSLDEDRRDALEALGLAWEELGRRDEAIRQLRSLVDEDPYRERAWAGLIRALYANGRQADALGAYADVRRFLSSELGLEPGPELQDLHARVLAQDPALAAPKRPSPSPRGRRGIAGLAAAAVIATGAVAVAVALPGREAPRAATGQVLRIDATSGATEERFAVGRAPAALTAGAGTAWVLDADARTISAVGDREETFATGAPLLDVALGAGTLFVGTGAAAPGTQIAGPIVAGVQRVLPSTQAVRATVRLRRGGIVLRPPEQQLAPAGDALWTVRADGSVARVNRAGRVTAATRGLQAVAVAAGPAGLWAVQEDGPVARLDPTSARVAAQTELAASSLAAVAVGRTDAWVTAPDDGVLWRVPRADPLRAQPIRVGRGARAVAAGGGAVWVANPLAGTLTRIDERSGRVTRVVRTGGLPQDVAIAGGRLWASVAPGPDSAAPVPGTVAGARCEPAVGRPGASADVLLVSDLPVQGGVRVSTQHMTAAIAAEVRARGFRAGRFDVAYASCDDSVARTGVHEGRPARSARLRARAFTREPRVLVVVGSLSSPCSIRRGARPTRVYISPLSTDPALTRPPRPQPFVRVISRDDLQGAGLALLARRLRAKRVYVADDGDPAYGGMLADAFTRAAARTGVRIVGAGAWDPARPERARLGREAARLNADAVVLAGTIDDGGVAVLREMRRALGRRAEMLLVDGFTSTSVLSRRAGRDADGAYVTIPGVTLGELTPAGRGLARRLRAVSPGAATDLGAYYAAQAAAVALDAIARSDGTRASVLREVRRTRIAGGYLGPVRFDAAGDIASAPVTVLRVRPGDRSSADFPDARVEQVLRPASGLLAP